jgi:hypothetical protein
VLNYGTCHVAARENNLPIGKIARCPWPRLVRLVGHRPCQLIYELAMIGGCEAQTWLKALKQFAARENGQSIGRQSSAPYHHAGRLSPSRLYSENLPDSSKWIPYLALCEPIVD